jgi:hypothetical protein
MRVVVAPLKEFPPGERRIVQAGSRSIGVFRVDANPSLIACPWHGWEYDLETGQSFLGPGEPRVKAYDVSVEKGDRMPGPYVAETFDVFVEEDYVVLDA